MSNIIDFASYRKREADQEDKGCSMDPTFALRDCLFKILTSETSDFMDLEQFAALSHRDKMYLLQSAHVGALATLLAAQSIAIEEEQGVFAEDAMESFVNYWTDELLRTQEEIIEEARKKIAGYR